MNVRVALFSYGGVEAATVFSLLAEEQRAAKLGSGVSLHHTGTGEDALISRSRSRVLSRFIAAPDGDDVLVMVDHDIAWRPGDLAKLARRAGSSAIVAGLYSCRAFGCGQSSRAVAGSKFDLNPNGTGMVGATHLATGFTAFPLKAARKVLEACKAMPAPLGVSECKVDPHPEQGSYWSFFQPFVKDGEYLSEDYAFSERASAAGVPLFVAEGIELVHHGKHGFTLADSVRGRE